MSDTGIAPAALNRITGMLARRYSAQPTPRDLDVANIAAAAERERLLGKLRESGHRDASWLADWLDGDDLSWLEGDTDGQ